MGPQLEYLSEVVQAIKPGHELRFDYDLMALPAPPPWTAPDWILEGVIGAAWEYSYRRDDRSGDIIFRRRSKRLNPDGRLRTYVSPDRKHYFKDRCDGLYELRQ